MLPAGAELVVRVQYRKTWEYERRAMTDRSSVGLYFTDGTASEVLAVPLGGDETALSEDLRALAIYPDPSMASARVRVTAVRPDGSREELIAFRPKPGWARRYWFAEPIALPRGTRITVTTDGSPPLLAPGALPPAAPPDPSAMRLTLNAIRIREL
jgi:hypothetical protein